ncbi:galactosyltransferase-related protein [Mycolicibacter kumamotonensis]|uniref:Galactosyltransferase C-terminal domain-containing protein n=1 Tax=Mycolicibacter kumamotonensis TaxID=354243 RepID=A0A1B8SL32_9MYCO|nr:galactosyltransferase-related protein [Mycolicibacter kumamotonensis]OBY33476.1 hypothetical protein ACT18_00570 [Mycolicibacter kumamotonensis]
MIPVLVPYRGDNGWRDDIWTYLKATYWAQLRNDYTVFAGHSSLDNPPETVFSRSSAINTMAHRADLQQPDDWDVAVIADADTWVPSHQLDDAVILARRTGRLAFAFTSVIELSEHYTKRLVETNGDRVWPDVERVRTAEIETQSSMLVVPRKLWDRVGGFDERFIGWGCEDNAFAHAATILGGSPLRIEGAAFHLWHPSADKITRMMDPQWRANHELWKRYANEATCECSLRKVQGDARFSS